MTGNERVELIFRIGELAMSEGALHLRVDYDDLGAPIWIASTLLNEEGTGQSLRAAVESLWLLHTGSRKVKPLDMVPPEFPIGPPSENGNMK